MGNACLKIILETCDGAWVVSLEVGPDAVGQIAGNGAAWCMVGSACAFLEIRPHILRHLGTQIAHAMGQTTLASGFGEADFDGLDDARRPVRDDQQRIAKTAAAHILEECRDRFAIFLRPGHEMQQNLSTVLCKPPCGKHWLAFLARPDALSDTINEHIGDVILAQISGGEFLVVGPQPLADLRDRRSR